MSCYGAYHDNYEEEQRRYLQDFKRSRKNANFYDCQDLPITKKEDLPQLRELMPCKYKSLNLIIIKSFLLGLIIILLYFVSY